MKTVFYIKILLFADFKAVSKKLKLFLEKGLL